MLGVLRWQWHQLDHMQTICTSLQTDNYTKTSLNFYSPDALLDAAQQYLNSEGLVGILCYAVLFFLHWYLCKTLSIRQISLTASKFLVSAFKTTDVSTETTSRAYTL